MKNGRIHFLSEDRMKFKDAAEAILEKAKKPLHFGEITKRALDEGLLDTVGATPGRTMGAQIYTEILYDQKTGREGRFVKVGPGLFGLKKWEAKGRETLVLKEEEQAKVAEEITDLSGLTSTQKGRIVENRIRELILLYGGGALSVYEPASDIEAIDLIVLKKGEFRPIYLQVKSRFGLSGKSKKTYIQDIREKTFEPYPTFFIVYAYFNPHTMELHDNLFLIPSDKLRELAVEINPQGKGKRLRLVAPMSPKPGTKWAEFIIDKTQLADVLLQKIEEAYQLFR
ncbi:winged helix-turn-helix domain-containing protein [Candidatus Hakubella thermalkaliphila]|uniref:winged helix-turn-helix domain-containing protein n=1 Tax=Candidatus Hakubella thermalkaliphila TaxID=2754717 RepID=UPI00159459DF|nr:winged helix-turn-helix domain-containing protein [Candidatus Hakubella thermalkaliphila]